MSDVNVPLIDLKAQYESLKDEIESSVLSVLRSTAYIMGPDVEAMEKEAADYLKVPHSIGVGSGTDALLVPLLALGVGPGDEVVTTPFTFIATAECISILGAKPVFVDIDPVSFNLRVDQIESVVTPRTKAIIPVHLYGRPVEMDPLLAAAQKHRLAVIEDAAQAIGAKYKGKMIGSLGRFGAFSFFPAKNLGCAGDGGLVTVLTDEDKTACDEIRVHGSRKRYDHARIGYNCRLDTIQAAIVRVKLKHIEAWTQGRIRAALRYRELFDGLPVRLPEIFDGAGEIRHVYNQFTIRSERRDALQAFLKGKGIPSAVHYPTPLSNQDAFSDLGYKKGAFPESEKASQEVLSLPIFPEITAEQQEKVAAAVKEFVGGGGAS